MKIPILTSAVFVVCLLSCHEDTATKTGFVVKVDASDFVEMSVANVVNHYYIIISDERGIPLSTTEIKPGEKYQISPRHPYTGKTFMLTELSVTESDIGMLFLKQSTYVEMEVNPLIPWRFEHPSTTNVRYVDLKFPTLPAGSTGIVSTNYSSATILTGSITANTLEVHGAATNLFATLTDNTTGDIRYRYFTNEGAGYTGNRADVDLTQVNLPMTTKPISFPLNSSRASVSVKGIVKNGATSGRYLVMVTDKPVIPDLPLFFDDYAYEVNFTREGYEYTNISFTTPDMEPLAMTLSSRARNASSVTYTTTGSYDYGQFLFTQSWEYGYGNWYVYAPPASQEKTITLPLMPVSLVEKWQRIDRSGYALNSFVAADFGIVNDYPGFLAARNTQGLTSSNSRSVRKLSSSF